MTGKGSRGSTGFSAEERAAMSARAAELRREASGGRGANADGQPAYARRGRVVCFFRSGDDDRERYSTFGFTPAAKLDDDSGLWPTSYAVTELTDTAAGAIRSLVETAAG